MNKPKKRLKEILKSPRIDLHGFTVQDAFEYCEQEFTYYSVKGYKKIVVVTGKSGQIRKEFSGWLDTLGYSGEVSSHGGSFTVYLK